MLRSALLAPDVGGSCRLLSITIPHHQAVILSPVVGSPSRSERLGQLRPGRFCGKV